jgi:uncharacterized membrane protein YhdT
MNAFHRTKRDSRWLSAIGLSIAFLLSLVFMLVGFIDLENESGFDTLRVIFGVVGICLFVLFMRGCWMATSGALVHVLSIDEEDLEWGFVGREKRVSVSEISQIYWDDSDGFTFVVTLTDGTRIRFPYMSNVVSYKCRGVLLAFLRSNFPGVPISGSIDAKTEQAAGRSS